MIDANLDKQQEREHKDTGKYYELIEDLGYTETNEDTVVRDLRNYQTVNRLKKRIEFFKTAPEYVHDVPNQWFIDELQKLLD